MTDINTTPAALPAEDPALRKKKWCRTLAIFCLVVAAGVFVAARGDTNAGILSLWQKGYGEAAGGQLVEKLVEALGAWLLFFFIVPVKRMGRRYSWIAYAAVSVALLAASEAGHGLGRQDQQTAIGDMQKAVVAARNGEAVDTTTRATGEAGAAEKFVKELAAKKSALERAYREGILSTDLKDLLAPARLNDDKDLKDSETMLAKANAAQEKYNAGMLQLFRDGADEINADGVSRDEGFKRDMLQALVKGEADHKKGQEIETRILTEYGAIVGLLKTHRAGWTVKNGELLMTDPGLSNDYQRHAGALSDLSDQIKAEGSGQ